MKKRLFTIATLFVAVAISVAVVSCQKDNETEENVVAKSVNNESKELLNRIYAFQELRDNINAGEKSDGSMSLQEMRDNIDLTFNYEHSQHATPFANATLDTFYVAMPTLDANGNVTEADAIATYNAFETNLEKLMASVDDDMNLAKNFSIKLPEAGTKSGNDIEVVFTLGTRDVVPYPSSGPFVKGDDYYWGKMLGRCDHDSTVRITDAAVELTRKFKFTPDAEHEGILSYIYDVEYVGYKSYEDPNDLFPKYIYYNDTTLTCGHRWLFYECVYGDEEPCITFDEMNCYWQSNNELLVSTNGALHWGPYSGSPYYECTIEWKEYCYGRFCYKLHDCVVTYAKIFYGNHE
ncbi:MAG: hypothetical protein IJZ06_01670 [Bacteroidales bacterium]|nr:hypothetical protein [Bacteroidales bacterium]